MHGEPWDVDGHPDLPRGLDGACSVQAPVSAGFGTKLVEVTIERIGEEIIREWRTDGLRVLISLPLGPLLD